MQTVGIIINPASGKDIRRLIARGMSVTNQEKINSVCRMILALDALSVREVRIMPDPSGLGRRVIRQLEGELRCCRPSLLDLTVITGTQVDTLRACEYMHAAGFACVIVMGGDGTCRVAAKGLSDTPMIPVSTGTNNVFPRVIEGTLAGMAAGYLALGRISHESCCHHRPVLRLFKGEHLQDIALVDIATVATTDIAARAVWEPEKIRELFLTHAAPESIGLSSIGGWIDPLCPDDGEALQLLLGPGGTQLLAPIAPGLLKPVGITSHRRFGEGERVPIKADRCILALDGEREWMVSKGENWFVEYARSGPRVVEVERVLLLARARG